jgi:hypothetical protein
MPVLNSASEFSDRIDRHQSNCFNSQCFVGNTIHNGDSQNKADCNLACAGNTRETCGGRGRIQIYEDSTWKDPTLEELADGIRLFNSTVQEASEVINAYQDDLNALQDLMSSSASKAKRDDGLVNIQMKVIKDHSAAQTAQSDISTTSWYL